VAAARAGAVSDQAGEDGGEGGELVVFTLRLWRPVTRCPIHYRANAALERSLKNVQHRNALVIEGSRE
jgi:hypothetical protein